MQYMYAQVWRGSLISHVLCMPSGCGLRCCEQRCGSPALRARTISLTTRRGISNLHRCMSVVSHFFGREYYGLLHRMKAERVPGVLHDSFLNPSAWESVSTLGSVLVYSAAMPCQRLCLCIDKCAKLSMCANIIHPELQSRIVI